MKKIIYALICLLIISAEVFPAAVTKYYNNWKIRKITYDNTRTKTITMTIKNDDMEIYIASRNNQLSISINWYKDRIDENMPVVQYSFDNSAYKSAEPFMRSSADNFDILYTVSPAFGIVQEKEIIDFFKKLINCRTLSLRPNNYGEKYTIDAAGLKEAVQKTDFTGTLFDKYKNEILR
ncbi:hypothetical protein [uncultured Brachyspira sp.]|uniref:hypothetical protein n=1 Tax=uncultured Brachyspira sp. TaxID=221953 RepID=UPI002600D32B|nr:hypothetical protein [uncultured Brachyspira sp.]